MKESKWRLTARQIIQQILADNSPDEKLSASAILKKIDDAYPFGKRANYPYQCWLSERRKALIQLGYSSPHPVRSRKKKRQRRRAEATNSSSIQLRLFD